MSHGLPNPPSEPRPQRDVECLAPKFRARVVAMLAALSAAGFDPVISESCRTQERQEWLYGFGRDWDDGRGVVTNAPNELHSWHGYGLAVDVISQQHGWEPSPRFWQQLGECARAEGLAWGGDWPKFPDRPHVQAGRPMRQAPSKRAAELLAVGGFEAVWKEVGAL